jgi:hypothetical protein
MKQTLDYAFIKMEFSSSTDNSIYGLTSSGQIYQFLWKRSTATSIKYQIKPVVQNKTATCFALHPTQSFLLAYGADGEIFVKTSDENNKIKSYILSLNKLTNEEGKKVKDLKWFIVFLFCVLKKIL